MERPSGTRSRTVRPARRLRAALALLPAILLPGCELAEVTAAAGVDVLVVESVLRAGDAVQSVLLHRSLSGGEVRGAPDSRVFVTTPEGAEVELGPRPLVGCTRGVAEGQGDAVTIDASCFSTEPGQLDVRPGAVYELRVETPDGGVIRGRTMVPGDFGLLRPSPDAAASRACSLPAGTPLEAVWSSSEGAWSYLAAVRLTGLRSAFEGTGIEAPDLLELTGVAISERDTTMVIPGDLGLFDRFDENQALLIALQGGLPAGVSVEMVVTAADRNFVNSVRGGSFNPSGSVRISSVVGDGIGLFGSLVPRRLLIEVGAAGLPACAP